MIELVCFDVAGTVILDSGNIVAQFLQQSLKDYGFYFDIPAINTVMGLSKPEAIKKLINLDDTIVNRIHDKFVGKMCHFYQTDPSVGEIPGASKVFEELRRAGIKVALDTGFSKPIMNSILKRLNWEVGITIDAVMTSDLVERGRPYPDMIKELMKMLNISDPSKVAKVGDSKVDLLEGFNSGCKLNIGVLSGTGTREELETCPHTNIVKDITEIPNLILHLDPESE